MLGYVYQGESSKTTRNESLLASNEFRYHHWLEGMLQITFLWDSYNFFAFSGRHEPIFPAAIGVDLLKLVHLSNAFRMVDGAKPLQIETSKVASETNFRKDGTIKPLVSCLATNLPEGSFPFVKRELHFSTVQHLGVGDSTSSHSMISRFHKNPRENSGIAHLNAGHPYSLHQVCCGF